MAHSGSQQEPPAPPAPAPSPGLCRKIPSCLVKYSAIAVLLSQPRDEKIFYPRIYLAASHEVFALTLVVTWIITLMFFPQQIFEHPAKPIIGSYNPCFGWDYAPASYIAVVCCSSNVYLTWRYSILEQTRALLLDPLGLRRIEKFAKWTSVFLAYSSSLWLLLWLLGPHAENPGDNDGPIVRNWFIHTGIFVTYASASYLAALGNYLEVLYGPRSEVIAMENKAFIITYGVSLGYLVFVYIYDLIFYEFGKEPALPPFATQFADFFWMACVATITKFLPREPPLKVTIEVLTDEEMQKLVN